MVGRVAAVLFALSAWSIYATFVFGAKNGFLDLMQDVVDSGVLPSGEALRTKFTGDKISDDILMKFTPFFHAIVDGNSPGLSLHAANFAGAAAALWTLVCVESHRAGNQGRMVAQYGMLGVLVQTGSFAVMIPLYLAFHLLTSPTACSPDQNGISASSRKLKTLPLSITAGYILPTVFMAMPETSIGFLDTKQARIAFWQPWTVWIIVFQVGIGAILAAVCGGSATVTESARQTRSSLRYVYSFALSCAAVPHIATWTISLASVVFPTLFTPDVLPSLHPAYVFLNKLPWTSVTASTLAEGALWLLHTDHLIPAVASVVWSITLWRAAHEVQRVKPDICALSFRTVAMCLLTGVAGAAVEIMWERDELLLENESRETGAKEVKEKQG